MEVNNVVFNQLPDHMDSIFWRIINLLVAQRVKMMMNAYESNQIQIQSDMFRQLNETDRI